MFDFSDDMSIQDVRFGITLSSALKTFNTLCLRFFVAKNILLGSVESYEE